MPGGGTGILWTFWIGGALAMAAAYALTTLAADEALAPWPAALLGAYYAYGGSSIFFPFQ